MGRENRPEERDHGKGTLVTLLTSFLGDSVELLTQSSSCLDWRVHGLEVSSDI